MDDVHATRGTALLALEPRAQTALVEDVVAGQLLAAGQHLLPTDDAHVTRRQLLRRRIRVTTTHSQGNYNTQSG